MARTTKTHTPGSLLPVWDCVDATKAAADATHTTILTVVTLAFLADRYGRIPAGTTINDLAAAAGLSARTIRDALNTLDTAGVIHRHTIPGGTALIRVVTGHTDVPAWAVAASSWPTRNTDTYTHTGWRDLRIILNMDAPARERVVALHLLRYRNRNQVTVISRKRLGELCAVEEKNLAKVIRSLQDRGFIYQEFTGTRGVGGDLLACAYVVGERSSALTQPQPAPTEATNVVNLATRRHA